MKTIILKILYVLSFIPTIYIILATISSYFWGAGFFYNTYYGFDGMRVVVIMLFWVLGYITVPLLVVCLIYQIFYRKKLKFKNKI